MCMRLLGTPASFRWLGVPIYIVFQFELAVWSRWPIFCVGVGLSGARASVQPVAHRLILAVGFSNTAATTPGTIG